VDQATLELFEARLARALPRPRAGLMTVPSGPGLGVEVEPDALEAAVVERVA
jgi:L-alanine-DL-glutamate epimerase-like enolase superfamily enzyme